MTVIILKNWIQFFPNKSFYINKLDLIVFYNKIDDSVIKSTQYVNIIIL